LTVRVEQRVDGLTPAQAGTEIFTMVLKKCVANALSLGDDGDHVMFLVRMRACVLLEGGCMRLRWHARTSAGSV